MRLAVTADDVDGVRIAELALRHDTLAAHHAGLSDAIGPVRDTLSATRRAVVDLEQSTRGRERSPAEDKRLAGLVAQRGAAQARHDALRGSLDAATGRLHNSRVLIARLVDELVRRGLDASTLRAALGGNLAVVEPGGGRAAEATRLDIRERATNGTPGGAPERTAPAGVPA